MRLMCPNNHPAVVREDPESEYKIGQCDTCGWRAPFRVADQRYEEDGNHERLEVAQGAEVKRRQLEAGPKPAAAPGEARRRSD